MFMSFEFVNCVNFSNQLKLHLKKNNRPRKDRHASSREKHPFYVIILHHFVLLYDMSARWRGEHILPPKNHVTRHPLT